MQSRNLWIGAGLLAALVAAFITLRPETEPGPAGPAPAATQATPVPAPAAASPPAMEGDLKQLPPEIRVQIESALKEMGATSVRVASLDAQMARGKNNLQWLFTHPAADAPDWQREIWDKQMAPLMYPDGHPRKFEWRDNVTPEDVVAASAPMLEKMFGADYLDQPILYVPQKKINFDELNMARARLWNRDDPSTTHAFYEWLKAAPEDPNAYPSDFQLPAQPGDPDAITYRKWYSDEIARQVAEQIAEQRGRMGS